jgi:hypothetical protein
MSRPNKRFKGCIATRTQPKDYSFCVKNYDDPEYQNIDLVPSRALKRSVYTKTQNPVLYQRKPEHISFLPRGLRAYLKQRPAEYKQYLAERKAEIAYLKTLKRGVELEQAPPPPRPLRLVEEGEDERQEQEELEDLDEFEAPVRRSKRRRGRR